MIQVKVYDVRGGKLIFKSKKVKTFKQAYKFVIPYYPENYVEIHGKRAK